MDEPLGYLLTWSCYGTWLHGDPRGSVDEAHNQPGEPFLAPDSSRLGSERWRMSHAPVFLNEAARSVVAQTVEKHCQIRGWDLHACNPRSNHVHVVVSAGSVHPDNVMEQLKAWSTRRLREAGLMPPSVPVWTESGSRRYLWKQRDLAAAVEYVNERQGPEYH